MTTNLVSYIRSLVPQSAPLIGEVIAIGVDNTSIVRFPDGTEQSVRGTSVAVGEPAFVRDGVIEMRAPAYTATVIEI